MVETLLTRGIENGGWLFPFLAFVFALGALAILRRRRSWLRAGAAALCGCAVIAFGCAAVFAAEVRRAMVDRIHRGEDFSFQLLDGTVRNVRDYRGKIVLVNFWATWCGACQAEMPDLERIARERAGDAVVVITVSDEPLDELRKAVPMVTARLTGTFSDLAPDGTAAKMAYAGRPSTLVIDRRGNVRKVLVGLHDHAEFEAAIRSAL
jgi:thiol-disulfide isomerase/thioredoxin